MGFTNDFSFSGFHLHSVLDWKKGSTADNANNLYFDNSLFLLDSAASAKRSPVGRRGSDSQSRRMTRVSLIGPSATTGHDPRHSSNC